MTESVKQEKTPTIVYLPNKEKYRMIFPDQNTLDIRRNTMSGRRLYRSSSNRILLGVCGGIGRYLNVDPTIIRILAVVIPGFGWLTYLICAILMPPE